LLDAITLGTRGLALCLVDLQIQKKSLRSQTNERNDEINRSQPFFWPRHTLYNSVFFTWQTKADDCETQLIETLSLEESYTVGSIKEFSVLKVSRHTWSQTSGLSCSTPAGKHCAMRKFKKLLKQCLS